MFGDLPGEVVAATGQPSADQLIHDGNLDFRRALAGVGPSVLQMTGGGGGVANFQIQAAEGFQNDGVGGVELHGFVGVAQGGHELRAGLQMAVGEVVEDARVVGVGGEGGTEDGNGVVVAVLLDEGIALPEERGDIGGVGGGGPGHGGIGGGGAAVEAAVVPEVGEDQFLLAGGLEVRHVAGGGKAKRGLSQGVAPGEEGSFRDVLDFAVAVEEFNDARLLIPRDGDKGGGSGLVFDAVGQEDQQRQVVAEFIP
ncbi:MAG: hypothetical protein BWX54_01905 [Verrucomicrobia bacterium ADurb.Bin018]|nr:MAG: hypothetical protein BWX54_01905 [Verrucomicrobia bacterium ADurb.Bin018]